MLTADTATDSKDEHVGLHEAIELLHGDTKQRLLAIQNLQNYVDSHDLGRDELIAITDAAVSLLNDNNFKICVGALKVVCQAAHQAGEQYKALSQVLAPSLIERLGDGKAAVRNAAYDATTSILKALKSPNLIHERFNSCWKHKNSHIREGILSISIFCLREFGTKFTSNRQETFIQNLVDLLADSNSSVRETAMDGIEEAYRVLGRRLKDSLSDYGIRPTHMKEINSRLDKIQVLQPNGHQAISISSSKASDRRDGSDVSPSSKTRRGGYKDAGGVSVEGLFQKVEPIFVTSSHDLQSRLDAIKAALYDTSENWHSRMEHMVELEAIIVGNAKHFDSLAVMLNQMKGCFIEQVLDRRSAVSRQACHLLTVLAENLGSAADNIVEHIIPVLFKVVVISVQVQADAAHSAIKDMMRSCHIGKIIVQISNNLETSRNSKLRCACIEYIHLILDSWNKMDYDHFLGKLESGLKSALSDASKDVRASARSTFLIYQTLWPDRANALFEILDSGVQKALMHDTGKPKIHGTSNRTSIRKQQMKSDFAAQLNGDVIWPGKVLVGDKDETRKDPLKEHQNKVISPQNKHKAAAPSEVPYNDGNFSHSKYSESEMNNLDNRRHGESASTTIALETAKVFSVKTYLSLLSKASWSTKVELNTNLREWLLTRGSAAVGESSQYIEKLVFVFVDHFNDPHHKVVLSSLELFNVLLPLFLHVLENYVERFCPPLFLKIVDAKERIRNIASEVLMLMGQRYSADVLIPALIRSLKIHKPPRARVAVLEFSVKYFKDSTNASPNLLTNWISVIGPLICEKVVEVRRAATAAFVRVYQSLDSSSALSYILSLPPQEQNIVRKAVQTFVGSIDEELVHFASTQDGYNLCWLDKASPSKASDDESEDEQSDFENEDEAVESHFVEVEESNTMTSSENISNPKTYKEIYGSFSDLQTANKEEKVNSPRWAAPRKDAEVLSRSNFALREKCYNLDFPLEDSSTQAEKEVEMHDLEVILTKIGTANLHQEIALRQFTQLVQKYPISIWEVFFEDTISKLVEYIQYKSPTVKACALLALKECALYQQELLSHVIEGVMSTVLGILNHANLEVKQSADECLCAIAQSSSKKVCIDIMIDYIHSATISSSLVLIFRALGCALSKLQSQDINSKLKGALPHLFSAFNSKNADLRKAVVFCLVDIYNGMGDQLMPHLSSLSTAQLKLLTIYIQRSQSAPGKENSAPILS